MNLLGLYPGDAGAPGVECAGEVVEVGEGVTGLALGTVVVAIAAGCLASRVVVDARLAHPIPPGLDWAQLAGQPVAYLTAMLALDGITPGERVLVHAGAGGVGHAVIALAQAAGADLAATAGSPAKRDHLRRLGVTAVHDSRTLAFAEAGPVDRLINCLTGDAIPAGLDMLAPGGRFVELGRAGIWAEEQVCTRRPDIGYTILALDRLITDQPDRVGRMLADSSAAWPVATCLSSRCARFPSPGCRRRSASWKRPATWASWCCAGRASAPTPATSSRVVPVLWASSSWPGSRPMAPDTSPSSRAGTRHSSHPVPSCESWSRTSPTQQRWHTFWPASNPR